MEKNKRGGEYNRTMTTFGIMVLTPFNDIKTGVLYKIGEIMEADTEERAENIIKQRLGVLVYSRHDAKKGKSVLIHHTELYKIGGIETAAQHISRAFADYNITFVVGKNADTTQVLELSKRHSVILDNDKRRYTADVLILMNYDGAQKIINRVDAPKVYQFVHADWENLLKLGTFKNFRLQIHPRVDKVLAVSETAQKGLKTAFGIDSVVVPNVLCPVEKERLVFLVLSRATNEKGIETMLDMFDRFEAAGKDFVVFLCSPIEQAVKPIQDRIRESRHIFILPASPYNQDLLKGADFLIQLSHNESYCYSVREALQRKVPCIVSDIPELAKLIRDGENGYVLKPDLSNLDIDKIFNKKLKLKAFKENISPLWEKVLEGEL